ncbi:sulfite oxidase heme-binding subunit YedZ [Aestuariispira insulae]|uniref:Protein-methionine-sulfoxide reductase heme-binding subunit MsrQ n=1 Tax=Aestuariispira insulae TaxID=1461337 RepID=A0A3D9HHV6_9PROT|nr:protein-methionine-sulfoxide reductase heme-binding subunit MsrQ [Aestuariispira insulae]RED49077.1 sulfoxide reductase heme-binding subunit YedZ [Aestuariispira insulae]
MDINKTLRHGLAKPVLHLLALLPAFWLGWLVLSNDLGANPIERVNRFTGDWALYMLLIALAVTPAKLLSGWKSLPRFRRMLGLYSFFYASLHLTSYLVLDHQLHWGRIIEDITKRPYIMVGLACVIILTMLAVTSPKAAIRKLGAKAWQKLHKLVYAAGCLGVIHYYLLVKADIRQPLLMAGILLLLFGIRFWHHRRAASSPPKKTSVDRPGHAV